MARQVLDGRRSSKHFYSYATEGATTEVAATELNANISPSADTDPMVTLDAIYRRYAGALRDYCARQLGDPTEAEDVCHEVMIRAFRALPRYRAGPMWPWLVTIARNACLDVHRRRIAGTRVHIKLESQASARAVTSQENMRNKRLLDSASEHLSPRYRALIDMADLEGWSYERIARAQGVSVGAVRSALMRARSQLKCEIQRIASTDSLWVAAPACWYACRNALRSIPPFGRRARASLRLVLRPAERALPAVQTLTVEAVTAVVLVCGGLVSSGLQVTDSFDEHAEFAVAMFAERTLPDDPPGPVALSSPSPRTAESREYPARRLGSIRGRLTSGELVSRVQADFAGLPNPRWTDMKANISEWQSLLAFDFRKTDESTVKTSHLVAGIEELPHLEGQL